MSRHDQIFWKPEGSIITSGCPVCKTRADQPYLLDIVNPFDPDNLMQFVRCVECKSGYVHNFRYPDYEGYNITKEHKRFYVEQGAGVDILARPGFVAKSVGAETYLEIGCGYGFGVDFAEKAMGLSARGIDPAPQASAGRDELKIPIEADYLTEESGKTLGLNDFIVAMEVIEHIEEPQPFIQILKMNLTKRGVVMMSTPNIKALEDRNNPILLPIISPGFHSILFSAEALRNEFLRAGFGYVNVDESDDSLLLTASLDGRKIKPAKITQGPEFARAFIDYTADRMNAHAGNNSIWSGFSYRHFKALVNSGDYDRAHRTFTGLVGEMKRRFAIDVTDPLSVSAKVRNEFDVENNFSNASDWSMALPYNLCNWFFFAGILFLNTRGAKDGLPYFTAAIDLAIARLAFYDHGGYGDGETAELLKQSQLHKDRCEKMLASA